VALMLATLIDFRPLKFVGGKVQTADWPDDFLWASSGVLSISVVDERLTITHHRDQRVHRGCTENAFGRGY